MCSTTVVLAIEPQVDARLAAPILGAALCGPSPTESSKCTRRRRIIAVTKHGAMLPPAIVIDRPPQIRSRNEEEPRDGMVLSRRCRLLLLKDASTHTIVVESGEKPRLWPVSDGTGRQPPPASLDGHQKKPESKYQPPQRHPEGTSSRDRRPNGATALSANNQHVCLVQALNDDTRNQSTTSAT